MLVFVVGGFYIAMPAALMSRGKDPWHSLLCCAGLGILVFGIGIPTGLPHVFLWGLSGVGAGVVLLTRLVLGQSANRVENFAPVYLLVMIPLASLLALGDKVVIVRAVMARPDSAPIEPLK